MGPWHKQNERVADGVLIQFGQRVAIYAEGKSAGAGQGWWLTRLKKYISLVYFPNLKTSDDDGYVLGSFCDNIIFVRN